MATIVRGDFNRQGGSSAKPAPGDKPVPIYELRLALSFSQPPIWRRVRLPASMSLAGLHVTIQACMGWQDIETHQFLVGKIFYQPGAPGGLEEPEYDEARFTLHQLEQSMQFIFTYLYDGGGGWEVELTLEEVLPADPGLTHPVLLDGRRACPPEDIGDIHHYQALLAALAHGGAAGVRLEMPGGAGFDPDQFDIPSINAELAAIV